jgi:hypothetical protein
VTAEQQRAYLGKVADRFSQLKENALDAYYTRDEVFSKDPTLKLITRVRELNERYAKTMYTKGHTQEFAGAGDDDEKEPQPPKASKKKNPTQEPESRAALYSTKLSFAIPDSDDDEFDGLLTDPYRYTEPI